MCEFNRDINIQYVVGGPWSPGIGTAIYWLWNPVSTLAKWEDKGKERGQKKSPVKEDKDKPTVKKDPERGSGKLCVCLFLWLTSQIYSLPPYLSKREVDRKSFIVPRQSGLTDTLGVQDTFQKETSDLSLKLYCYDQFQPTAPSNRSLIL